MGKQSQKHGLLSVWASKPGFHMQELNKLQI